MINPESTTVHIKAVPWSRCRSYAGRPLRERLGNYEPKVLGLRHYNDGKCPPQDSILFFSANCIPEFDTAGSRRRRNQPQVVDVFA